MKHNNISPATRNEKAARKRAEEALQKSEALLK
jgi:hypothetical protein